MNKIKDILSIQLENDIKNVIDLNTQKENEVKDELDGFILTESLAKHLSDFLAAFSSDMKESGVWLSGFYGSGKSYFAKMIGLLISNPMIAGTSMRDRFLQKLAGLKNEALIKNDINSLAKNDYQVVLFDSAKVDASHGIAFMAMSRFLLSLGLMNNWMGFLEYEMYLDSRYTDFLDKVKELNNGKEWDQIKNSMASITKFREAAIELYGITKEDFEGKRKLAEETINSYDADKLKNHLNAYLNQNPSKRVIFFIDEVSEALTQKKINLLDLEGLSEALSSLSNRVWTVGIAQQAFQDVLNSSGISLHLLNKVEARFKTRIPIAAEEIDTIIRRRLLTKTEDGKRLLDTYYNKNNGTVLDVTNIAGIALNTTKDAETYSDYYPFFEHQFKMLQYFLFGSRDTVTSQIGTRGMLVSVFDVLKKESMTEEDVYSHVNSSKLCNQAEENIPEALRIRYEQATAQLTEENFKLVEGKPLLQAIHFLDKAGAKTTAENIARSYVRKLDQYYDILEEVKHALSVLEERNVLIASGNQYKITSQIEQQIIDEMNAYDIQTYRAATEVTKALKQQKQIKQCQSVSDDGLVIPICVETSAGESLANQGEKHMKVSICDLFYQDAYQDKVAAIKQETQTEKGRITLVPSNEHATKILDLAKELLRISYIEGKNYSTSEEKKVQNTITSTKEEKMHQFDELIRKTYTEGSIVYLYNTYQLNDFNWTKEMEGAQHRMFSNIYTQRLSATLSDALAETVLKKPASQLAKIFGTSPEFGFFDTSGKFIGDGLSVVTTLLSKCKSYITGKELEVALAGPPTGYNYGTIVTSMAALFRGNKVVIKYNGEDFHSVSDSGCEQVFKQSKNFGKASFKAVLKSLSYKDRQEIVDILKQDCNYHKNTGEPDPSYNLNDFEIIDHLRTLSREMMERVKINILFDDEKEKLFKGSVQARNIFSLYTDAVTDANYIATANTFLQDADNYITAVERVERDLRFIDSEFRNIEEERRFIENVVEEFEKTGSDNNLIKAKVDLFREAREKDLVANAANLKQWTQNVKDIYYKLMKHAADVLIEDAISIAEKLNAIRKQADAYPKEWNITLYNKLDHEEQKLTLYSKLHIELKGWNVKCVNSNMLLRDLVYKHSALKQDEQEIDLWDTEIHTENSNPQPQSQPTLGPTPPPKPQPAERKMRAKMPSGTCSVALYRNWLKQQLTLTQKFGDSDILNFDE